jgi:2-oxoisovalerate dehydrogenase E2 component (dihydrolipoyl transacylase)
VLFRPQIAIGAIGKIAKVPKFLSTLPKGTARNAILAANPQAALAAAGGKEDPVVPAHIMTISWAADHRVVDGASMARFSNAWKEYLENPASMLAHLR